MNEYDLEYAPDFDRTRLPSFHEVFNAKPEHRNRELLEFVFRHLIHGTPGNIVAEMMREIYWALDNSAPLPKTFRGNVSDAYEYNDDGTISTSMNERSGLE